MLSEPSNIYPKRQVHASGLGVCKGPCTPPSLCANDACLSICLCCCSRAHQGSPCILQQLQCTSITSWLSTISNPLSDGTVWKCCIFVWCCLGSWMLNGICWRIHNCCCTAIESLHDTFVWPLTADEKEVEKRWIDMHMGFEGLWQDGWVMYDGTIVVLYAHPGLDSDAYYTQKANYGLNLQASPPFCALSNY